MTPLLLDTCAVIWIAAAAPISEAAKDALCDPETPAYVSPISAWEVGLLVSRGRLPLSMSPQAWFRAFLEEPGAELAPMVPDTLIDASFLPGEPPRDPADRVILATARAHGMRIVTRDRAILSYAKAGHAWALEC